MNMHFAYFGRSALLNGGSRQTLSLAPNLAREAVAFDAELKQPLRFREAISALHDVVISDLRFKKRDKTAYEAWKKAQEHTRAQVRKAAYKQAKEEILARREEPVSADLELDFEQCRRRYWNARQAYATYLIKHDTALWRKLMPCDPVITVGPDVVFFECFSADESSYGCLSVNRTDGFGESSGTQLGTTNVDYSWDLYNQFQSLRSYLPTRFRIDPAGFEVATSGHADYREEKIDLPDGWLRGFMQTQSAMVMPGTRVKLSREAVYSILAWHKRHKARSSPRAIRFELLPGQAPVIVLEPWEQRIVSTGTVYDGPPVEPIRVWGGRRLLVLARVLPLVEHFEVQLVGTGLPSFWLANMGEMTLTLGLSGWTTNDWTRGSALDMLAPPAAATNELLDSLARALQKDRWANLGQLKAETRVEPAAIEAGLRQLALTGQVIHDLPGDVYRWRQIMPMALGEAQLGPPNPELVAAQEFLMRGRAEIESRADAPAGGLLLVGKADHTPTEVMIDADGRIRRGKCLCGHHRKYGLRNGPCRHLLALRWMASRPVPVAAVSSASRLSRFGDGAQN